MHTLIQQVTAADGNALKKGIGSEVMLWRGVPGLSCTCKCKLPHALKNRFMTASVWSMGRTGRHRGLTSVVFKDLAKASYPGHRGKGALLLRRSLVQ